MTAMLFSERGLVRSQNQDKALAFQLPASARRLARARVFVLADGMGGMRDGAGCAALAAATFASALLSSHLPSAEACLLQAAERANDAVRRFAEGSGGSTLSALLVEANGDAYVLNVGDSRIYAFGSGRGVERLTIDDSLAERVGGSSRELVRFIGMNEGFGADIRRVNSNHKRFALTSDGIHFIAPDTFTAMAEHAASIRTFVEHVSAVARWSGSPDNATVVAVDLSEPTATDRSTDYGLIFYDAFSSLEIALNPSTPSLLDMVGPVEESREPIRPAADADEPTQAKKRRRQTSKIKSKRSSIPVQYEISVGAAGGGLPTDADR